MKTNREADEERVLHLRLYIADETPRSLNAVANLKKICKEDLSDKCHIEIFDIAKHPESARRDQIVAIPTLLRKTPKSLVQSKRIIGDLSNSSKVLAALKL